MLLDDLPGHFAVWAAFPEAAFLHGRYVWTNRDVEDLGSGEIRRKIEADPWYLKVGVKGLKGNEESEGNALVGSQGTRRSTARTRKTTGRDRYTGC